MNSIIFTQSGFDDLKKEEETLKVQRKEAVLDLKKARDMGDLSENGYYRAAKFKLSSIDRRIRMVHALLKNTKVATIEAKDSVDIGCQVTINDGKEVKTYLMVGGYESNPQEGKLSIISPIGRALQGKKKHDIIHIESPSGKKTFTIENLQY
jgi:transcription elongation factor GreA